MACERQRTNIEQAKSEYLIISFKEGSIGSERFDVSLDTYSSTSNPFRQSVVHSRVLAVERMIRLDAVQLVIEVCIQAALHALAPCRRRQQASHKVVVPCLEGDFHREPVRAQPFHDPGAPPRGEVDLQYAENFVNHQSWTVNNGTLLYVVLKSARLV